MVHGRKYLPTKITHRENTSFVSSVGSWATIPGHNSNISWIYLISSLCLTWSQKLHIVGLLDLYPLLVHGQKYLAKKVIDHVNTLLEASVCSFTKIPGHKHDVHCKWKISALWLKSNIWVHYQFINTYTNFSDTVMSDLSLF